ncbi:hypothetical protein [Amycolatopsis jejuensis]|nr:hypothetical protein [Amycolatopsis jejuensis]
MRSFVPGDGPAPPCTRASRAGKPAPGWLRVDREIGLARRSAGA